MPYKDPEKRKQYQQSYHAERAKTPEWIKHRRKMRSDFRVRANELIRSEKSKPCADCNETYPYYVMDFDHRPGETKVAEVARLTRDGSLSKLQAEIAKCDVVCANCHRIRTHERKA